VDKEEREGEERETEQEVERDEREKEKIVGAIWKILRDGKMKKAKVQLLTLT
jgi:hypothetical protein